MYLKKVSNKERELIQHLKFDMNFSIKAIIDIFHKCLTLDYTTEKPGNIGPSHSFDLITYTDYERVSNEIVKYLNEYFTSDNNNKPIPTVESFPLSKQSLENLESLGKLIFGMTDRMIKTPPHKNLLLGTILLSSPLIYCFEHLKTKNFDNKQLNGIFWEQFWNEMSEILEKADYNDAYYVMNAILISKPGGVKNPGGKPFNTEYDLFDSEVLKKIKKNRINLIDLFKESEKFDMICHHYVNNYNFSKEFVLSHIELFSKFSSPTSSKKNLVQEIFLRVLAKTPDSLIYRKNSKKIALEIQNEAKKIIQLGSMNTKKGRLAIEKLTEKLNKSEGGLNPGTTADITTIIMFIACIFGIIIIE